MRHVGRLLDGNVGSRPAELVKELLDRLGNNAADEAADFGRRKVDFSVIDWSLWSVVSGHPGGASFFVAFSRAVVNHVDGSGPALDPLVCWCSSQKV